LLGLVVLLDTSEHPIERISEPPSDAGLDSDKTAFLIAPGSLTAADANALNKLAEDGGRVVVAGDPGDEGLSRLLRTEAEIGDGTGSRALAPLTPSDETAGVTSIESPGSQVVSPAGSALPIAGAAGEAGVVATDVGEGRVIVVADNSILENSQLLLTGNARFALNLAGEDGREVQLVEAVRTPPGSGLSALPGAWGWGGAGLILAGLALAWARGRRIGPVELASRPLPPPRRQYVDAMAGALLRTREPRAAITPLREAARDLLARRAGLPHDASDTQLREAAVGAGLEPAEVEAVSGQVGDGAMLAAAGAVAKLSRRQTLKKEDG
ncbi:MAG: DUF4350 domain-containing protein, partial [Solirubrobacterales bacterium]